MSKLFIAAVLCQLVAVSAFRWSERSWKVHKETGVVTMILEKQPADRHPEAHKGWYPATISKDHSDVKSWAMLEHEGETYLVGSQKEMKGRAMPSEEEDLLVFKVSEKVKSKHDGNQLVMKLAPQKPQKESGMFGGMMGGTTGPEADFEGKETGNWWPWAPFWGPWPASWVWAWPTWPFDKAASKSLERNEEMDHLMTLEGELGELIGLEKDKSIEQLKGFKKKPVPGWSGFDPVPGLPGSLYKWVDTPPAIGSIYGADKKTHAPKEAAKKFGVWPVGVWWAGTWYWPK